MVVVGIPLITSSSAGSLPVSTSHSQLVLFPVGWEAPEGIDSVLTLTCRHALGVERETGGQREWGMWALWAGEALGNAVDAVTWPGSVRPEHGSNPL